MPRLASPLAVVCHDLGAAQLILPWLDPERLRLQAFLQGPALEAWRARFGERGLVRDLDAALAGARQLLSGSGWSSPLEHRARIEAEVRGLPSIGVLDHWIAYAARFQREGRRVLPSEIWVADAEAYGIARATFPGHPIALQPNLWLREQVERMAPCPAPLKRPTVLLLPEPVGDAWGGEAPGEEQALDYLITHAAHLGLSAPLNLRLRPHDSDVAGRWDAWMQGHQGEHHLVYDPSATLAEAIEGVAWVAGLESSALALAHAAGRRAVCLQPGWAPRSRLPQRGLIHLRDLVAREATR